MIGSRVTTENYERAWNAFPFARYMFNSIFVGLATTALTVFTSAMAAYAFARLKFKGRDKVFFRKTSRSCSIVLTVLELKKNR